MTKRWILKGGAGSGNFGHGGRPGKVGGSAGGKGGGKMVTPAKAPKKATATREIDEVTGLRKRSDGTLIQPNEEKRFSYEDRQRVINAPATIGVMQGDDVPMMVTSIRRGLEAKGIDMRQTRRSINSDMFEYTLSHKKSNKRATVYASDWGSITEFANSMADALSQFGYNSVDIYPDGDMISWAIQSNV